MSLDRFTAQQLHDMHADLFTQTVTAADRYITLVQQMTCTSPWTPEYAVMEAQRGPLKAAMHEKDELFQEINDEINRRYEQARA